MYIMINLVARCNDRNDMKLTEYLYDKCIGVMLVYLEKSMRFISRDINHWATERYSSVFTKVVHL